MKRLSYKKNNKIVNKRLSKINGGRPPVEDNQCKIIATLEGHIKIVLYVAFHPSLPLLATGSLDTTAKLWRLSPNNSSPTCLATLEGHSSRVSCVVFHPTAPLLATGSWDKTVRLWSFFPNGTEATCVATLLEHRGHVFAVVFHPSAPYLATGSMDTKVKLWLLNADCSAATCVSTLEVSQNGIAQLVMFYPSIAFHSTAPLLAAGSENTVKLWRCKMLEVPYTNFILYPKNTGIDKNICNSLCFLCYLNLCMKNVPNPNNINGYVVKLTNGTPSNDFYIHYKCIYWYLLHGHLTINDLSIASETIQQLLHITDKTHALTGADFYN